MTKIAVCSYEIKKLVDWDEYRLKIESLVTQAKQHQAQLLLLPEYSGVEIICGKYDVDKDLFADLQPLIPKYIDFYKNLAKKHQIYIQPGTILVEVSKDKFVNRAHFFGPDGNYGFQDKLQLIEFEKELRVVQSGEHQQLFKTSLGTIGIAICYDSEFPEIVRRLVKAGATLILVPSYTSSMAGYYRVSLSCRARAIENQCYVAVAYVVNSVELSGATDYTMGRAGIYGPADTDFPDDGIIAEGNMNEPRVVIGEVPLDKLLLVRKHGQVHNFEDMKDCESIGDHNIKVLNL